MKCTSCTAYGLTVSILLHSAIVFAYFSWNQNSSTNKKSINENTSKIIELSLSEFTIAKDEHEEAIVQEEIAPEPEPESEIVKQPPENKLTKEEIKPEPIKEPPMIPHTPSKLAPIKLAPKEKQIPKPKAKPKVKTKPQIKKSTKPKKETKPKHKLIKKKLSKSIKKVKKTSVTDKTVGQVSNQQRRIAQKNKPSFDTNEQNIINRLKKKYQQDVLRQIEKNKHYPKRARRMNKQGSVIIEFIIDKQGNLIDVKVIKAEGHSSFAKAAIKAVRKSGQFQPIPEELGLSTWKFRTKLVYMLK